MKAEAPAAGGKMKGSRGSTTVVAIEARPRVIAAALGGLAEGHRSFNNDFLQWFKRRRILAPLPIGFAVFLVHLATIPITGTGIIRVRSLGAAIIFNKHEGWHEHLLLAFAGPASNVRVERTSRDCFADGGALADVLTLYENMGGSSSSNPMHSNDLTEQRNQQLVDCMGQILSYWHKLSKWIEVMNMLDLAVQSLALNY